MTTSSSRLPMECKTLERRNGDFNCWLEAPTGFYNFYALPNGDEVMVRLDTTEQDKERNLNRSEHVRQIGPGDDDFFKLYVRRSHAESINRYLDDSMFLGRAHSKGARRQSLNLVGFACMVNSLAIHLFRKRRKAMNENNSPSGEAPPVRR